MTIIKGLLASIGITSRHDLLIVGIPAILLVVVVVAVIMTRGKKKIETEPKPENKTEPVVPLAPANVPAPTVEPDGVLTFKVAIPKPAPIDNSEILKAIQELREGMVGLKAVAAASTVVPLNPNPNVDPMDVVHRVDEPQTGGSTPYVPDTEKTPLEKATKIFWQLAPGLFAVLVTLYLLQGYVKLPNYAADSKGLNDRVSQTENATRTALAGLTTQINIIGQNVSSVIVRQQTFATANDITQLQNEIKALQTSVAQLQKTANTTSNVTK